MVRMVETVRDELPGPEHRAASERLDRERDDIRSAIDWALRTDDAETVGQLLASLFIYWWSRGLLPMTYELAQRRRHFRRPRPCPRMRPRSCSRPAGAPY